MSPGPNKRKSTKKKKKKAKPSKSSASTPEHSPSDGESDDGEFSSSTSNSQHTSPLPPVKLETSEDKKTDEKESKIEIDKRSQEKSLIPRSSSANKSRDKKKAVAIEPANFSPEKGILNPVNNKTKRQQKNTKSPLKQTGVDENSSNLIHPKETGLAELVEKLVSVDEKASPKSKDCLTASTLNCPFCGRGGADRLKKHDTPECPEKYPLLSPNPFSQAPEKTSWKSCCGLFELCSGSSR
ncbi:unnamed protein product [Lactuca virosa]|uniref:Uncharacterized protein n=1 Tax=Lactuca virosa TaxID=75947 RepID=A0AAU9LQA3_9ASTR|nr:unnamed protein product [Lactuca virosa]